LAGLLAVCLASSPSHALVTFNDSHDRIKVNGSFSVSRDSNIFASADNAGDFVYSTSLVASYQRRAGWIGVNASVSMGASRFGKNTSENFSNPSYSMELTKQSGRTTGSFTLNAARESRADAAVNFRTDSWNYNAGLNFKYPNPIGFTRATLTGGANYSGKLYADSATLANLSTYSTNLDLIYMLPRERDFVAGYRYRYSATSRDSSYSDHSFSTGISGKLIFGLNGSIRAGLQSRVPQGSAAGQGTFSSWSGSSSIAYPISRKLSLGATLAKDFSTTATDASVDSLTASVDAKYAHNRRWSLSANAGWGDSYFLGEKGRVIVAVNPIVLGPNRHEQYVNWGANVGYTRSEHFSLSLSYSWFQNWSTTAFSDFVRTTWSLSMSSGW
jgi:hypothetical protein